MMDILVDGRFWIIYFQYTIRLGDGLTFLEIQNVPVVGGGITLAGILFEFTGNCVQKRFFVSARYKSITVQNCYWRGKS